MSKEFKIGLLAIVSTVMLYAGFNFLKGSDFLSSNNIYFVIYDRVDGLTISNPVQINGLNVGRVANIEILQGQNNRLLLTLEIRNDLKLGEKSLAVLTDNGLLGGKMIDLKMNKSQRVLQNRDTLQAQRDEGMIAQLTEKADPLVAKADSIMGNINQLTKALADSKEEMQEMLSNLNSISDILNNTLAKNDIDQIVRNLRQLSSNLLVLEQQFHPVAANMDSLTQKFNNLAIEKTVKKLDSSMENLNQILAKVNKGEGTLGALANNDSLYTNLNKVTQEVDKLFIDLRENPKRYLNISVFGKKEKKP